MREQTRDSVRWRSSPSRPRVCDRRAWGRSDGRDVLSRLSRSPVRTDWDSRRLDVRRTDWEADVGGIRREYVDSDLSEAELRRRDVFSKREREEERDIDRWKKLSRVRRDAFSGEVYPVRCESVRTEEKSLQCTGGVFGSEEELHRNHERSRDIFVRSTVKHQCWRDDPEPSRSISSHEHSNSVSPVRNVTRNTEVGRLGSSGSRNHNDIERLGMQSYRSSENGRAEAVFIAMKGEGNGKQCCEYGKERDCYVPVSLMSCVGSSSAEMEQDNYRRVNLNTGSVFGFNDSDWNHRIGDRKAGSCSSRDLNTRDLGRHVDRNSSRRFREDEKANSFHSCSYCQSHNRCYCVSSTASMWSKHMVGAFQASGGCSSVSDITVKELCTGSHRVEMDRDPVHYMHMRRPLSKPRVTDAVINQSDGAGTIVGFCTRERVSDQYESINEHCPVVQLESSILDDRVDDACHCHGRKVHYGERNEVYLDNKIQQLRKNYPFDDDVHTTMYPDVNKSDVRDERSLQFRGICHIKGNEAYMEDERRQVQKDCEFDSYARMYHDVNESDVMMDRDERDLQFRRISRNSDYQSQQVHKDYEFDSYERKYSDFNGSEVMVDQDERALQFRRMGFDKGKGTYLENGSQQLQKHNEFESYAGMYRDVSQLSDLIVNRGEETRRQYRSHHLDGGNRVYLDEESVQLGKADHAHLHDRKWELDNRQEVYTNVGTMHTWDNYSRKSHILGEPDEVVYENIAEVNYDDVEQFRSFEDQEIAYDHRDKQYAVELTRSERIPCLKGERSFGHDDQNQVSSSCPRIPVKERLGGRVKDPSFRVKNRLGRGKKVLPWMKNVIPKNRMSHGKNQKNNLKSRVSRLSNS